MPNELFIALATFADEVSTKLNLIGASGEPEEQLRAPFEKFIQAAGNVFGMNVVPMGEVRVKNIGKPDYAIHTNDSLCGYVEVKRVGKGADPTTYQGHDRAQWERFKTLPCILYTDGNEWALFQGGERASSIVRMSGNIEVEGARAVTRDNAVALEPILRSFLTWNPIVPNDAQELAKLLAPICRLLRLEVAESLEEENSAFHYLYREWQTTLFPGQSQERFADAYAQTVTFALLLANAEGGNVLDLRSAVTSLNSGHALLSKALKVFTDNLNEDELPLSLGLLQRTVAAIPPAGWKNSVRDPWLYFYEDFLAEYDPQLRKDSGSYYTPVEVVRAMIRLIENILKERMGMTDGFADPRVMTLDPAVGTGTFLLGIVSQTLEEIASTMGAGATSTGADMLKDLLHGFELQVGPYSVAQLRLSRALENYGASMANRGPNIFLTDTLESPDVTPQFPSLLSRELSEQHKKALEIKKAKPILICLGNPPYDRHAAFNGTNRKETGGWIRWGNENEDGLYDSEDALLEDFAKPVRDAGQGGQLKNLYNLYVYFWRWAMWKVFEQGDQDAPGIVSFITASSFLEGAAFLGMRERMRRQCDEIWIIDLGGEGRGARAEENVFNIQTPVCITLAVRYGRTDTEIPASVHYARIAGTKNEKLSALKRIANFSSLAWADCPTHWQAKMIPDGQGEYFAYPLLQDLFPWQQSGVKAGRTWVIGSDKKLLVKRWNTLFQTEDVEERRKQFKDSPPSTGGCNIVASPKGLFTSEKLEPIAKPGILAYEKIVPYGYRSFDRQYVLADARCLDRSGPPLWKTYSSKQAYFSTLTTTALSCGPALSLSADIPDLHHFRGSYGAKDIIPLYRDSSASCPNIVTGLLELLSEQYHTDVTPEDFSAYVYAVLAHSNFTEIFHAELESKEVRVPLTKDATLFSRAVEIGRRLIWLHSYGERMIPLGEVRGKITSGAAKYVAPVSSQEFPDDFSYDESTNTLSVGDGKFAPVSPEVFNFEVSGLKVVSSWLKYRTKGANKKSSPLDDIRPERWTLEYAKELLNLLWILEATLASYPEQKALLEEILEGPLFIASELPEVPEEMREAPQFGRRRTRMEQASLI